MTKHLSLLLISLLIISCQGNENNGDDLSPGNRKSPIAITSVKNNGTYIKVVYGQPYRNGRDIFGDLVPYGEVWRTGANEATEITITETILVGEEAVQAGTYSLFSIPGENEWTIILNSTLGQWGAFDYNQDTDYKRIIFPVKSIEDPVESFSISFSDVNLNRTIMSLKWDTVQVDIPIRFY
ncbi:DUF2911 domain-containing protein [Balneola sp. MJW-20]|uniref:DUF2911 domain-containing protein n=1 Tax=Gracilimonas aurantiaca TaxID=3234185 RepID=UPI003467E718